MLNIKELANKELDYMVGIRRELHQHPELSLQEKWTSNRICQELDSMNIDYVIVGDYGIVATIEGQNTNNMLALRADMDALPVNEENDHLEYKSTITDVMHACGHDAHVAMLLGAAKILLQIKNDIPGTIKLCFQQAEEVGGGAKEILDELDKFPIKTAFGIHIWSEIESGKVSVQPGPRMSGGTGWSVHFKGKGTHGAIPEDGISPIIVGSSFVLALNSARAYEISPLKTIAITIGAFNGGHIGNVIPEEAKIIGTIRVFSEEDKQQALALIQRVADHTAKAYNATAVFSDNGGIPPLINDIKCTEIAQKSVETIDSKDALTDFHLLMPSENYGLYIKKYPGLMAFIGGKNDQTGCHYAHHHPKFNIDEKAMVLGAALHAQYSIDFLKQL